MRLQVGWMLSVGLMLVAGLAGACQKTQPVMEEPEPEAAKMAMERSRQPAKEPEQVPTEPKPDAGEPGRRQDAVLAEIKKLGGKVEFVKAGVGRPVMFLYLCGPRVTNADLVQLKELSSLGVLYLWATHVTDDGLEHLEGLTNLVMLDLTETQITGAGLKHLKGLPNLARLKLLDTRVTDAGLVHLIGMKKLRNLDLSNTQATDAGLVHLRGLTELRDLNLRGRRFTDAGLLHLKGLTNLRRLNLARTRVTDAGVMDLQEPLPNCTILRGYRDRSAEPQKQPRSTTKEHKEQTPCSLSFFGGRRRRIR